MVREFVACVLLAFVVALIAVGGAERDFSTIQLALVGGFGLFIVWRLMKRPRGNDKADFHYS